MNKDGHAVRQPLTAAQSSPADRRVLRTQRALTQALIDLVGKKRYERITIQNLLDRADVARSTFYAHYRGKDDLLLRSFERMLDGLDQGIAEDGSAGRRVAPARELFHHVGALRSFHRALARARMLDRLYQVGTRRLSAAIERRLAALPEPRGRDALPPAIVAEAAAGALFALLRWWIDQDAPFSPEQMDAMYHAIVL